MKAFRRLCIAVIIVFLLLTAVLNLFLVGVKDKNEEIYRVEAKRLADEIKRFVSEITKAASEDFMSFEVTQADGAYERRGIC